MKKIFLVFNVTRNLARPALFREILRKIYFRFIGKSRSSQNGAIKEWCSSRAEVFEDFALDLDQELWIETGHFLADQQIRAADVIPSIDVSLGGGGHVALLYFLTRYRKPSVVLETGVAAGHSSRALLMALAENGSGRLFSSDFPYFRLNDPEKYIGIMVEEHLRENWLLATLGDRINLPTLSNNFSHVDLFHYDSDKSYEGRRFAFSHIAPFLSDDALIIFDDIEDNWHFRDLSRHYEKTKIFKLQDKYVGLIYWKSRNVIHDIHDRMSADP